MTDTITREAYSMMRPDDAPEPWWRGAVIYEVYVRSFADSDGDGIGDLAGVMSKVPYLAELGVDALWLTPFYPSPMADGGYDVADYRDIDPSLGTLAGVEALIERAHAHGLRIIIDIVPNHTSRAHAWFGEALAAAAGSAERARYLFRDGRGDAGEWPPNDWESVFGGPAWTRLVTADGAGGQWYLHLFDSSQPDLNWENDEVRTEFDDVLRFWLDRGVDGFRIDVAHGMVKAAGLPDVGELRHASLLAHDETPYFDQDGVHDIHRQWRRLLDTYPGERIAVAEAWAPNPERLARYVRPDEAHQAFNFHYLGTGWHAPALRHVIDESLAACAAVGAPATWVLSNHDVQRHVTRFGDGDEGVARARAAALLMLALPGSAYLYQGEELGLPEVLDLPDDVLTDPVWTRSGHTQRGRDGCRVPLPWSGDEPPYGFSATAPWLPQPSTWAAVSVQRQAGDPDSMLSLYRDALRIRRGIGGDLHWYESAADGLLAFGRGERFACTVNAGDDAVEIDVPGELLLATGLERPVGTDARVTLPPSAAAWWQVGAAGDGW